MAIRQMKFVSIVGKLEHFDKFVSSYIIDSNLHPENAMDIITLVRGVMPFPNDESKSDHLLKSCVSLLDFIKLDYSPQKLEKFYSRNFPGLETIERRLSVVDKKFRVNRAEYEGVADRLRECRLIKSSLENILDVNVNVEQFFNLEFVKFRFGRVPKEAYKQLELWAAELDMLLVPMQSQDERYTWLIYFTPSTSSEKVDGIVSSMQFERTRLSSELTGTPQDALLMINQTIDTLTEQSRALETEYTAVKDENTESLLHMYFSLARINRNHEVRRNAVCTDSSFYICGWIPEDDMDELAEVIAREESDTFVEESPSLVRNIKPPTELKNRGVFKFFEVLVKMYGLPSYNEIDPTAFIAITYFLMFGIMFGDVGQGAIILLAGLVLIRRKFSLAGVFMCVGTSSILFGFIYGSLFGDEEILPHIYGNLFGAPGEAIRIISPMEDTMTMLIGGVIVGVLFMLTATVFNILNGLQEKNLARVLFDRNGAAGVLFYLLVLGAGVFYAVNGRHIIPFAVLIPLALILFFAVFFKEPLERLIVEKKSFFPPGGKGMFFAQGFFEMVDMLLSMASNTLSFIRVGAFALNHVGLFMAFHILAGMAGSTGSIFVNIFANVLIIGLEGLIVGIQCLRLEYYELFSRFFKGDGKVFRPLRRNLL